MSLINFAERRRKMRSAVDPFPNLEDKLWLGIEALDLARGWLEDALAYEEPLSTEALETVELAKEWIEDVLAAQARQREGGEMTA